VSEYCDQFSLEKRIGLLDPETKKKYMLQIASGIQFLHQNNIAHRDIKPENIFLHQNSIKIGDLGLAKITSKSKMQSEVGTLYYMDPQIR
jgi:serine/threonine protein kinase